MVAGTYNKKHLQKVYPEYQLLTKTVLVCITNPTIVFSGGGEGFLGERGCRVGMEVRLLMGGVGGVLCKRFRFMGKKVDFLGILFAPRRNNVEEAPRADRRRLAPPVDEDVDWDGNGQKFSQWFQSSYTSFAHDQFTTDQLLLQVS